MIAASTCMYGPRLLNGVIYCFGVVLVRFEGEHVFFQWNDSQRTLTNTSATMCHALLEI